MKRFLIATCVLSFAATEAFAAPGFSWFHTRPKSVLLADDPGTQTAKKTGVQYRGSEMYPRSGRLYFEDQRDKTSIQPASQSRSRMSTIFSRGWSGQSTNGSSGKTAARK